MMTWRSVAVVAAVVCASGGGAPASEIAANPTIIVEPIGGIADAPFDVTLTGLPPGSRVTIRATRVTEAGAAWTASGVYNADASGVVTATSAPSLAGTYSGLSPHGLICAALPVEPDKLQDYIANFPRDPRQPTAFPDPLGRAEISVSASIGDRVVATTKAWRSYAEATTGEDVAVADGWKGVFFPPAANVRAGVPVLLLPGSGGGVFRYSAARLASHGHPTFAMAMFRYPGLPDSLVNFPVERVRDAALWLAQRAGTKRVAVMGISRGSEAASLAAVHFPDAFVGLVLVVPSHLSDAGALGPAATKGASAWTIGGRPTPVTDLGFTPDDPRVVDAAKALPGYNASAMVRDRWGSDDFSTRYGIPFERLRARLLVLAAGDDGVWPSWISAEAIRQRLKAHGKSHLLEMHLYPDAGHSIVSPGYGGVLSTFSYHPLLKGFQTLGGTPNGNCEASFDVARRVLDFLGRLPEVKPLKTKR